MAIRLSGLTSGLDTDAIVQELVSAYSLKTQKYEKAQTKLEWKQDIWKNLNTAFCVQYSKDILMVCKSQLYKGPRADRLV